MDAGSVDEVSSMKASATLRDGLLDFVTDRGAVGVSVMDDDMRREGCDTHAEMFRP